MLRTFLGYVLVAGLSVALAGCGSKNAKVGSNIQSLSEVNHMEKRSDGRFSVTCSNGKVEVRTESEILANQICDNGSGTDAVVDFCEKKYWSSSDDDKLQACFKANSVETADYCSSKYWSSSDLANLQHCFTAKSNTTAKYCDDKYWSSSDQQTRWTCYQAVSSEIAQKCADKYWSSSDKDVLYVCFKAPSVARITTCGDKYGSSSDREKLKACLSR